jgi:DNA polymerase-4
MRRGIIASASYEARRYGVYTPMPTSRALRVCPHLIVIPGDYERFEQFSRFMFSYVYDFTPEVEIRGIDEGYFNLTGNRRVSPVEALETIRDAIRQSLKISVSQGLGTSKIVSQIASKIRKPNGLVVVQPGRERQFLYPLPVSKMPGIGPAVASKLNSAGITRLEQLARMPRDLLRLVLGKSADTFRDYSRGIDPRPIVTSEEPAKSYGHQDTFSSDTVDDDFVEAKLKALIDEAVNRMRRDGKSARTLSVTIRYSDMEETTRGVSLHEPGDLPDDFYGQGIALLKKAWDRRVRLRMIRVKLSNIYNSPPMPDLLTVEDRQRRAALQQVLTQVQSRYGPRALMRAHELFLRDTGQS